MFTISKRFDFSASHQLSHLPEWHKCASLHGHNYAVDVVLEADELDQYGFVMDYGFLKDFKDFIDQMLDHKHLNSVLGGPKQTTAEALAKRLYEEAVAIYPDALYPGVRVVAVRVSETPKTWAEYSPS